MEKYRSYLDAIAREEKEMLGLLKGWCGINSWSDHPEGLKTMVTALKEAFRPLGKMEEIPLPAREVMNLAGDLISMPTGNALHMSRRPNAPFRIFFGGHMDTVFPPTGSFLEVEETAPHRFQGPGVADMKGGLLVMLKALEVLEKSPHAEKLGWEIVINADEEVGSVSSRQLIEERGAQCDFGLIFEPSFPDGAFAAARKGSANYSLEAHGKTAHAGRDFTEGRNAIIALAHAIIDIKELSDPEANITVNIGRVVGGGPTNIVPDYAFCQFNVRTEIEEDLDFLEETLEQIIELGPLTLHKDNKRPPKPFDTKTQELFEAFQACGKDLGIDLSWRDTGGVCDGNLLAAVGVPTIDTLGVVGGNLHTDEEYMEIDSLVTRAQLTALFLLQFAEEIKE